LDDFQSLGCTQKVESKLKEQQRKLVTIYMIRMGAQSSASVCDPDFLETQTRAIGKVLLQQKPGANERVTPLGSVVKYAEPKD
jgi:hypothetical protein